MTRPRIWLMIFSGVALSVFALKLQLAYTTKGAPDISAWKDFLKNIEQCGVCVYQTGGLMQEANQSRVTPFNHPPFMIHALRGIGSLAHVLNLDFAFVLRALTSMFDLGSAVIVYKLLRRHSTFTPTAFLLYLLAPATIIISGFHGQTDTVMIFFVLLAAYLIPAPLWAGVALGCALSIKVVPIIFAGVFLFYLPSSKRYQFLGTCVLTGFVLALPFIAQEPILIAREVLGYGSFPGRWGWTRLLFATIGPTDTFWLISRIGAYALLFWIFALSFNLHKRSVPLLTRLSLMPFILLSFTPSWGTNYMSWLDPFPLLLGILPSLIYYLTSGALLGYLYFIKDDETTRLIGLSWLGVLIVTLLLLRKIRLERRSAEDSERRGS